MDEPTPVPGPDPDPEMLTALDGDDDPVAFLMLIVRRRLDSGQPLREVISALRSVWDEDPMPVIEVIDWLESEQRNR